MNWTTSSRLRVTTARPWELVSWARTRSELDSTHRPPICVLPADAIVLLVQADNVRCEFDLAVARHEDTVKISVQILSAFTHQQVDRFGHT